MKTKLLKRIRKDLNYKFKDGKCYTLSSSGFKEYKDIPDMLLSKFYDNWDVDSIFEWGWVEIANNYKNKLAERKFRQI